MAKIVHPGLLLPAGFRRWPLGTPAACPTCGCQWIVENGDAMILGSLRLLTNARQEVRLICPHCGGTVTHQSCAAAGTSASLNIS